MAYFIIKMLTWNFLNVNLFYYDYYFKRNVMSTIFSQQILNVRLLLVVIVGVKE